MNDALTQNSPGELVCKQRVLNYGETCRLLEKLRIIKYKKDSNGIHWKQYGYYYDNELEMVKLKRKIPRTLADYGKGVISRMGLKMRFNHVQVQVYSGTQKITPKVDDVDMGEETLVLVIGDMCPFVLTNLKNAKNVYETKLYNGSCMHMAGESRYLWAYSTIPMFGTRWIITFRDIPVSKIKNKNKNDSDSN